MCRTPARTDRQGHEDQRILALAGIGDADEDVLDDILRSAGFEVQRCTDMKHLCTTAERGAGALLVTEASLIDGSDCLAGDLQQRTSWPDVPIILISADQGSNGTDGGRLEVVDQLNPNGCVFLVERPIRRDVLLLAAKSALAARQRQYDADDLQTQHEAEFAARKHVEDELTRYRERMTEIVEERSRELEVSHQQVRQVERMASMGTLAAGLGHDLGNLVFPLRIRVELMRSRDLAPELQDDLDAIYNAVQYLQRLANGLRHMAMDPGESGIGSESTDLEEWWADVEAVFGNALPRTITLERQFASNLPRVAVPAHGLAQAVFDLIQNSCDAMANNGAGSIVITAALGPNATVQITVCDNGPGMTHDVRQRCLEPFFTTKVRGISTGLGLAIVHGVIKRAGGTIGVASEPGAGTVWTLTLPCAPRLDAEQAAGETQPRAVVDLQDRHLGAFVATMLRTFNFFVSHSNGSAATPPDDAAIWITDKQSAMADAVLDFVSDKERFVVLIHQDDASPPNHPRILHTDGSVRSDAIRKVLRELVIAQRGRDNAS